MYNLPLFLHSASFFLSCFYPHFFSYYALSSLLLFLTSLSFYRHTWKKIHPPRGGSTQTGLALKYVLRKGFPGGRNSSSVAQIVILLSDGKSQGNVVQAAAQLKETGVVLFAVGLRYPRCVCWMKITGDKTLNQVSTWVQKQTWDGYGKAMKDRDLDRKVYHI